MARFLAKGLPDNRDARRIWHSGGRLARTLLLLAGPGRREHSDATALRDDPALRLATSDRARTAPLGKGGCLPSQPTLSRRVAEWSAKREGQVHTAEGGLGFVLEVLERADRHLCDKATVRFDAGSPSFLPYRHAWTTTSFRCRTRRTWRRNPADAGTVPQ